MRLYSSAAVLIAGGAVLTAPLAAAPAAKPRLLSSPPTQAGARWTGMVAASGRPAVVARLGRTRQAVAVRRVRPGRYRLQAVFRSAGRWTLTSGSQRLGSVLVRPVPPRLTNALDVVVEPAGSLLVADFSNRVFRLSGDRLTLVAGSGRPGRSGDGARAVAAAIGFPVEVAVDPRGGFGIVHDERWVRHVDPTGTIRTVAEFQQPTALAYDAAGNLFVSELLGGVKRVDAASDAVTSYTGFNQPHGLSVAADGTVYVADTFNNRVQRIAPNGTITTLAGGLNQPNDVALGTDGNVYATDYGTNGILRITPVGTVTRIADASGPSSVAVGADGTVYFTERNRGAVRQVRVTSSRQSNPREPALLGPASWPRSAARRSRHETASRRRPSRSGHSEAGATGCAWSSPSPAAGSSSTVGAASAS